MLTLSLSGLDAVYKMRSGANQSPIEEKTNTILYKPSVECGKKNYSIPLQKTYLD